MKKSDYKKTIQEVKDNMKKVVRGEKMLVDDYLKLMLVDNEEKKRDIYNKIIDPGVAKKLKISKKNAIKSKPIYNLSLLFCC